MSIIDQDGKKVSDSLGGEFLLDLTIQHYNLTEQVQAIPVNVTVMPLRDNTTISGNYNIAGYEVDPQLASLTTVVPAGFGEATKKLSH
ncbi:MAG: hypothetical protein SFT90_08380 [Rickettsiales bacterium]|nr:hypothetical protein [Rickettsiales bacterium]